MIDRVREGITVEENGGGETGVVGIHRSREERTRDGGSLPSGFIRGCSGQPLPGTSLYPFTQLYPPAGH